MKILQQAFDALRDFRPMSQEEVSALLAKTAQVAAQGKYELFKTSAHSIQLHIIRSGSEDKSLSQNWQVRPAEKGIGFLPFREVGAYGKSFTT